MSKKETMTKRFYSTSSAVNYPPLLTTLGEAIEGAKTKMFANNLEEIYVVEVVRIIRRVQSPIEIIETR